ncbi:S-adenosyl-L-methionine-dependent methyltransferase [Corynespora cassiicola Philippines]|uniref:S-adenosyl-L-methionine-dependent methyltransferase n=1 Tax=Corynespora cassiicola Philippines TaxID=1448308 RepID=A0A2T2N2Y0_CORCC|nr:S-adenosyl-L-methionine-dependent methyltransferase [Corynespora cassiicola Philippines]
MAALAAVDEVRAHPLGPAGSIHDDVSLGLNGITRFKIAQSFSDDTTADISQVSAHCSLHPADAERIIRHGFTHRLFIEKEDCKIAHSVATQAIVNFPHLQDCVEYPGFQEPNERAFNVSQRVDKSFFAYLAANQDKGLATRFANAMSFFSSAPTVSSDFAVAADGYHWSQHRDGTVVDVGGSHGTISIKLDEAAPGLKCIIQGRPEIVSTAPIREMAGKVNFQVHNFFTPQPIKGTDIYFFRWTFHDWSDKYCIIILRSLVLALRKDARVVAMEHRIPEPDTLTPYQEKPIREFGIVMKQMFNSKERPMSDWRALLRGADERFFLSDTKRPTGSQLAMIVAQWTG